MGHEFCAELRHQIEVEASRASSAISTPRCPDGRERLAEILSIHPALVEPLGFNTGDGTRFLGPAALADLALERAMGQGSAEGAAWVERILAATDVELTSVQLVSGIRCDAPIVLDEQLSFAPLESVRLTAEEFAVARAALDRAQSAHLGYLFATARVSPVLQPVASDGGLEYCPPPLDFIAVKSRATRLRELLPVIGPSSPRCELAWTRVGDPDFAGLNGFASHLANGPAPYAPPAIIDRDLAPLFFKFEAMAAPDIDQITRLTRLLAGAVAVQGDGDRAVRLATLLEATFCPANQRQGRRATVMNRLATLLGARTFGAPARAKVDTTFDVRNPMVHQGDTLLSEAQRDAVAETLVIAAKALREIVERGRF